jgi:hypothetical protein
MNLLLIPTVCAIVAFPATQLVVNGLVVKPSVTLDGSSSTKAAEKPQPNAQNDDVTGPATVNKQRLIDGSASKNSLLIGSLPANKDSGKIIPGSKFSRVGEIEKVISNVPSPSLFYFF